MNVNALTLAIEQGKEKIKNLSAEIEMTKSYVNGLEAALNMLHPSGSTGEVPGKYRGDLVGNKISPLVPSKPIAASLVRGKYNESQKIKFIKDLFMAENKPLHMNEMISMLKKGALDWYTQSYIQGMIYAAERKNILIKVDRGYFKLNIDKKESMQNEAIAN